MVVNAKDDVFSADVLVNPDIVLIDIVSPGGKLIVVGELVRPGVGLGYKPSSLTALGSRRA